jgi:hypothetical protein
MNTALASRWRLAAPTALLIVSCLLLLGSLGAPWMYLTNSFLHGVDATDWYTPGLEIIDHLTGRPAVMWVFGLAYIGVVAIIVGRCAWQIWSPERADASGTKVIVIAMALVGLGAVVMTLLFLPIGLELGYPFYDVTIESGGFVAVAGLVCAMVGAALLETAGAAPAGTE